MVCSLCCRVLQSVAVCCSVLQCVAVLDGLRCVRMNASLYCVHMNDCFVSDCIAYVHCVYVRNTFNAKSGCVYVRNTVTDQIVIQSLQYSEYSDCIAYI